MSADALAADVERVREALQGQILRHRYVSAGWSGGLAMSKHEPEGCEACADVAALDRIASALATVAGNREEIGATRNRIARARTLAASGSGEAAPGVGDLLRELADDLDERVSRAAPGVVSADAERLIREWRRKRIETGDALVMAIQADGDALAAALAAATAERDKLAERVKRIRPLRETERQIMYAEHDIVHEARRLSNTAGAINSTRDLARALKRYDEAREADAALASRVPQPDPKEEE